MENIAKDPAYRAQYDTEPKPDVELEALLAGAPTIRLAPAQQITNGNQVWLPPLKPKGTP